MPSVEFSCHLAALVVRNNKKIKLANVSIDLLLGRFSPPRYFFHLMPLSRVDAVTNRVQRAHARLPASDCACAFTAKLLITFGVVGGGVGG